MKVAIAIDSLKGSLSSIEAGNAIKDGILKACPSAEVEISPLADGGEGTAYALTEGFGGEWVTIPVTGPAGQTVEASYGLLPETKTAIIEMSAAAGITLVNGDERNPMHTTTYGVGEMIADAIRKGCRKFIVGIGGSATNDGGVGMLQALGFGMLTSDGKQVSFGAKGLEELSVITDENVIPELAECEFQVACDVTNPLCGNNGCSAVFGPQKGATPTMVVQMNNWLEHYAKVARSYTEKADKNVPGTGAAGGLGFAFLTFTNAVLKPGIDIVITETKLEQVLLDADIVVTGEGRLDGQTVMGKAPIGVAKLAKKHDKTVIAFSGCVTEDAVKCNEAGIDAFFPILREVAPLETVMEPEVARKNMTATAEQVFRLLNTMF